MSTISEFRIYFKYTHFSFNHFHTRAHTNASHSHNSRSNIIIPIHLIRFIFILFFSSASFKGAPGSQIGSVQLHQTLCIFFLFFSNSSPPPSSLVSLSHTYTEAHNIITYTNNNNTHLITIINTCIPHSFRHLNHTRIFIIN